MGSGASKNDQPANQPGQVDRTDNKQEDNEIDNYEELYLDQKDEELVDVPLDAFPSLKHSRLWQSKIEDLEPKYNEITGRLMPKPYKYDSSWVEELREREIKIEVNEELLTVPIEELAQSIVEGYKSEEEKVLVLYRWMKEVETDTPSANEDHAAYYFARSAKKPIALLELFQKLCKACAIDCEIIQGFAKGATFARNLGDPNLRFSQPNHHWIAVVINQKWHLIDLSWCLTQNTDFYFLCEPAIFVYNHLPEEYQASWQLLVRPLNMSEFKDLAFKHKAFYYHDLELVSDQTCVIITYTGEEVITLRYQDDRIWSYRLTCEKIGSIVTTVSGISLDRCVMMEAYEGKVRFNTRFPSTDKYRLDIFCQDPDYTSTPPSLVVTYIIQVNKAKENFLSFMALDSKLYGPTMKTIESGLIPKSHTRGRISVEESTQIVFMSEKERYLVCELDTEQEVEFDLEQCVIDSYNSDEKELSINVMLPQTGIYRLMVYLEPENEGAERLYVISYLLECVKPFSDRLVFQNFGEKLGVQSMKKVLLEAIKSRNLQKLRVAVALMKSNKLAHKLHTEATLAEDMLAEMEKIDEMKQAIEQTDRGTVSEMRNYSKPPQAVHDVLAAALLLLGDSEDTTKLWTDVQSRCGNIGKMSLSKRIRAFNILYVHHEIAKRAMDILERHDVNVLQTISPGAALFYSWALSVSMEVLNRVDHKLKFGPASVKRQKEIFTMIAKGVWPVIETVNVPEVTV